MNRDCRKMIQNARAIVDLAIGVLEDVARDEQEAFDALPKNIQDGDQGETITDNILAILDAIGCLQDALEKVDIDPAEEAAVKTTNALIDAARMAMAPAS
jgi:CHASE3 domain sensor protein